MNMNFKILRIKKKKEKKDEVATFPAKRSQVTD